MRRSSGSGSARRPENFALILQYDNHGQKIDFCRAATVLLSKKSTAQDIRKAIGIDPALDREALQQRVVWSGARR